MGAYLKIEIMQKEGVVKFFDKEKGYGFIKTGNEELFVHATGLIDRNITEGDNVRFEVIEGKKGLNCINVELI